MAVSDDLTQLQPSPVEVRGINPPREHLEQIDKLRTKKNLQIVLMVLFAVVAGVGCYLLPNPNMPPPKRTKPGGQEAFIEALTPLIAGFAIIGFCASIYHLTVSIETPAYGGDAHLTETTKIILLKFIDPSKPIPSLPEIEEKLHRDLVLFQDEHQMSVLRVHVTTVKIEPPPEDRPDMIYV